MSLVAYASKTKKKQTPSKFGQCGWLESISWEKGHHQ